MATAAKIVGSDHTMKEEMPLLSTHFPFDPAQTIWLLLDFKARAELRLTSHRGRQLSYEHVERLTYADTPSPQPLPLHASDFSFLQRCHALKSVHVQSVWGDQPVRLAEVLGAIAIATNPAAALGAAGGSTLQRLTIEPSISNIQSISWQFPHLRKLVCNQTFLSTCYDLGLCTQLTDLHLHHLSPSAAKSIRVIRQLQHLTMCLDDASDMTPWPYFRAWGQLNNLVSCAISIPSMCFDIVDVSELLPLPNLIHLNLANVQYPRSRTNAAAVTVALERLAAMPHLQTLILGDKFTADAEAVAAVGRISCLTCLGVAGISPGTHAEGGLLSELRTLYLAGPMTPSRMLPALLPFAPLPLLEKLCNVRDVTHVWPSARDATSLQLSRWHSDLEDLEQAALTDLALLLIAAPRMRLQEVVVSEDCTLTADAPALQSMVDRFPGLKLRREL